MLFLLLIDITSDMAVGEVTRGCCGRAMVRGSERAMGGMLACDKAVGEKSGVAWTELGVCMLNGLKGGKAGLGRFDELLDTAVAGVTVSGTEVLTCCFGSLAGDLDGRVAEGRCFCGSDEVVCLVEG
jgi:hypothetical protein